MGIQAIVNTSRDISRHEQIETDRDESEERYTTSTTTNSRLQQLDYKSAKK